MEGAKCLEAEDAIPRSHSRDKAFSAMFPKWRKHGRSPENATKEAVSLTIGGGSAEVASWLRLQGMEQYQDAFEQNSLSSFEILREMTRADLVQVTGNIGDAIRIELGLQALNRGHRKPSLMEGSEAGNQNRLFKEGVEKWSRKEVCGWLQQSGQESLIQAFQAQEVDGVGLSELSDLQLQNPTYLFIAMKEHIGIREFGHVLAFARNLSMLRSGIIRKAKPVSPNSPSIADHMWKHEEITPDQSVSPKLESTKTRVTQPTLNIGPLPSPPSEHGLYLFRGSRFSSAPPDVHTNLAKDVLSRGVNNPLKLQLNYLTKDDTVVPLREYKTPRGSFVMET